MLNPNKFKNCELKPWADLIKSFLLILSYLTPCTWIKVSENLRAVVWPTSLQGTGPYAMHFTFFLLGVRHCDY